MSSAGGREAASWLLHPTPLLAIVALVAAALWPSPASLLNYWKEVHDYQHGFLIAGLAVLWLARVVWRMAPSSHRPSPLAAALLAPLLLLWTISERGGIDIAHQLLWPAILAVSIWAVSGRSIALRMLPPIGLLYAGVPVWDYGLPVLQRLSIFFSEQLLGILGVPATVTEYRVTIPEGAFEIIEGCSGKRYFVVTLAIAYLAIAINGLRGWRALVFFATAAILSMVTNWIRIVIIIYAGHVSNMQHYLVANEHITLGNVMFLGLIAIVLLIGRGVGSPTVSETPPARPGSEAAVSGLPSPWVFVTVFLLLLAAVPRLVAHSGRALSLGPLPVVTSRWQGPTPPIAGWKPLFVGADEERRAVYGSANGRVEIYANLYTNQYNGREMIHYGNNIVAPLFWTRPWSGSEASLTTGRTSWAVQRMRSPDQRTWLVTHAYVIQGRTYRTEIAAKLSYGWHSLTGGAPSGVLAAAALCEDGNCDKARMLVADFWDNMSPLMQAMMPSGARSTP